MNLNDVTCLIPLYRSLPQLAHVFGNIDDHLAMGGRVICSDQHGLDDAAARIAARYAGQSVRVLSSTQGGNWVSNCNQLIEACETPFMRIMPHDDSFCAQGTAQLVQLLRDDDQTVLAHGRVLAEHADGTRIPERDEPRPLPEPVEDPLRFAAELFWCGHFNGAFKSVIRRNVMDGQPLFIRPSPSLKHSERVWLFAYALLGSFAFEPKAIIRKRYWQGSVSDAWVPAPGDMIDTAHLMAGYADDLVTDPNRRAALRFNLYYNAVRRAGMIEGYYTRRPVFDPALMPL